MANKNDRQRDRTFQGYTSPNYTQVPDVLFDQQLPDLSGAELKVLLYIMRRTFGFKKDSDDISLNQICQGITTKDGRVLDRGTGLSKSTAQLAIKGLIAKNIILTTKHISKEKGNEATTYELNVPSRGPYTDFRYRGPMAEIGTALYRKSALQETVLQETDCDLSNFEGSHDEVQTGEQTDASSTFGEVDVTEHRDLTSASGRGTPVPLGEILQLRATAASSIGGTTNQLVTDPVEEIPPVQRRGRATSGSSEERERLRPFLEDFARELGDEAPLSSTITRTLTIFTAAGVPPEQWSDLLYQARGLTQEHTAQIRKMASGGGEEQIRRKNKMPYFLATLEQLVGVRPTDGDDVHSSHD